MIKDTVIEFIDREIWPQKMRFEEKDYDLTVEMMKKIGDLGLLGVNVDQNYGGLGMDFVSTMLVCDYISGSSGSLATAYGAHTGIAILPIYLYGNEEQKNEYLPKLTSGEWFGSYCLTEPTAGSDANSGKTKAELSEDGTHYLISGHKIYGPSGIGVLYGNKEWLEKLSQYQTGGEMIDFVSIQKSTYANIPNKFEAGTPNIVGAIALASAIDFMNEIGINKITEHSNYLTKILYEKLKSLNYIRIVGEPERRLGIVSFLVEGSHPHDVALLLDNRGISVRAGHHCAQPAMRHFNVDTTLRVSFGVYNNEEDIDNFLINLKDIVKYLQ